ncbi:hypothetical protein [Nannocystis pusilla]|uniref:hypothetical protein n=1 Tax=Nannocystis pusilla TaxID=889268 RepID=UPI003B7A5DA2
MQPLEGRQRLHRHLRGPGADPCGGFPGTPCPDGQVCVDDPADDCDPQNGGSDCIGICEDAPLACGGFPGTPCPDGQVCVDDPADDCDPQNGGADCIGICEDAPLGCGGFAGDACPKGQECVDIPDDGCDPQNGGADCPGVCQEDGRQYVSYDPEECKAMKFPCPKGMVHFFDETGCGCEPE